MANMVASMHINNQHNNFLTKQMQIILKHLDFLILLVISDKKVV